MAINEEELESFFNHESGDTVQVTPVEIRGEDESIDPDTHANIDYGITPPETDVDFEEVKPDPTECETKPKEKTDDTEERIAKQKRRERKKRREPIQAHNYTLKEDEVVIVSNQSDKLWILHSPIDIRLGSIPDNNYIETSLKFDKNLNILSSSDLYRNNKNKYNIPYLDRRNFGEEDFYSICSYETFIVVDKKKLFDSKGKVFSIKHIYGFKHHDALILLKKLKHKFEVIHQHLVKVKEIVGEIYDKELFEIMVDGRIYNNRVNWNIDILFPEVTLRNSKNQSHYLGTMAVRVTGKLNTLNEEYYLNYNIDGHRISWTLQDVTRRFVHSHLTSEMSRIYMQFCTGDGHVFDSLPGTSITKKEDLQSFLLMLDTFVKWESLEGGPYQRFSYGTSSDSIIYDTFSTRHQPSSRNYILMKRVIPFDKISNSFKLVRQRDELRYIVDEKLFLESMVRAISSMRPKFTKVHLSYIHYNVEDRTFIYSIDTSDLRPSNISSHISALKEHCEYFPETYINGKLIKAYHDPNDPWIKKENDNDRKEFIRTLNPSDMLYVAYEYLYELNKNLKDVKKQELEQ